MMKVIDRYMIDSEGIKVNIIIEKSDVGLLYRIEIPLISKPTSVLMMELKRKLISEVAVSTSEILNPKIIEQIKERFKNSADTLLNGIVPDLDIETKDFLIGKLLHEMLGLGDIEFLLNDTNLEEIVINSSSEPVRVYHKKYGWLITSVTIESEEEILNYSNIIARRVGRQITTLNPLLDAHLITGDRSNAVLYPISHKGNTITIRKFARDPWTITDFIQNKTCSAEIFALLWLAIQYEMNLLVSGGTGSGKTSFLNVIAPFMPPNNRILSIEDSVLGDSSILVEKDGVLVRSTVGEIIDSEIIKRGYILDDSTEVAESDGSIRLYSMNKNGKIELVEPSSFIRHKVNKKMYKIKLSSSRSITVTKDHSLFTLLKNKIVPIKSSELGIGSFIATPRIMDYNGSDYTFDLTNYLDYFDDCMLKGEPIKKLIEKYTKNEIKYINNYKKKAMFPVKLYKKLKLKLSKEDKKEVKIITKHSSRNGRVGIPIVIELDNELACLIGMWIADGCYDKCSIIFSMANEECNDIIRKYGLRFNINVKVHSDGISLMLNSKLLKVFFEKCVGLMGDAYTKKMPDFVYNLRKDLISSILGGYFSGDGTVKKNEICCSSASFSLLKDIQTLLLRYGIQLRIGKLKKDKTHEASISDGKFIKLFERNISFIHDDKKERLKKLCDRTSKEIKDIIPLTEDTYLKLKHCAGAEFKEKYSYKYWKSWQGRYLRGSHIGRSNLQQICQIIKTENQQPLDIIGDLAYNDLIWDQITDIEEFGFNGNVYDFSVLGNESFICENIIAHNTRELQLPKFLYWAPLTVRPPNPEGKGEITMLDLLVNSLRMRPDRIILGEIRKEDQARVLFEAMHTGHSVYATVHADSISETIRRLVNPPINVPKNLLSAVNLNVVMFRDRRKGIRRVFQIGEYIISDEGNEVRPNILYRWRPVEDKLIPHAASLRLFDDLTMHTGMSQPELMKDLKEKENILNMLVKKNIRQVDKVGEIFNRYYINQEKVFKK